MKKLVILVLFCATLTFAQNADCEPVKTENNNLKSVIKSLNEENTYLKKILDINKPIKEIQKDGILFKVTKVTGNLKDKSVTFTLLVETKDNERNIYSHEFSLVDIEGNDVKRDYDKTENQKNLTLNTPIKMNFVFVYKNGFDDEAPRIAKLVKLKFENSIKGTYTLPQRTDIEFKDLDIIWK